MEGVMARSSWWWVEKWKKSEQYRLDAMTFDVNWGAFSGLEHVELNLLLRNETRWVWHDVKCLMLAVVSPRPMIDFSLHGWERNSWWTRGSAKGSTYSGYRCYLLSMRMRLRMTIMTRGSVKGTDSTPGHHLHPETRRRVGAGTIVLLSLLPLPSRLHLLLSPKHRWCLFGGCHQTSFRLQFIGGDQQSRPEHRRITAYSDMG